MRKSLLLMLAACAIAACSDDDGQSVHIEAIKLSTDSLRFEGGGGFRYVEVDATEWYINKVVTEDNTYYSTAEEKERQKLGDGSSTTYGWLTIKAFDGRAVVFAESNKSFEEQPFQIEFKDKNGTATLHGVLGEFPDGKNYKDLLEPTPRALKFDGKGGTQTVTTLSDDLDIYNVSVEGSIYYIDSSLRSEETQDVQHEWLTLHRVGNRIEVTAEANTTAEPRTFSIEIGIPFFLSYIHGIQQAGVDIPPTDTIGFTPGKLHFPLDGGTMEVTARTDGWTLDWGHWMNWLTVEQDGNRLTLTATPNFDYDVRTFALRFRKGDYYEYIEGSQESR